MEVNGSTGPIWVVVNWFKDYITLASKEMLQDAAEVGRARGIEVHAVLIGGGPADVLWSEQVGSFGADLLIRADVRGIRRPRAEAFAHALERLSVERGKPSLVVLAETVEGQETAARLAVRWKTAYARDCVGFTINSNGTVEATRLTHGEKRETVVSFTQGPAIVSFRPGCAGVGAKTDGRRAPDVSSVIDLSKDAFDSSLLRIIPADPAAMDICEADFIVACGRGVGDSEGVGILRELARRLGASVAGTRRANDLGWIGLERRVGLTGKTVSPQLYMAVGISGAREHVVGMDESKVIIAINNDPKAEIFRLSHKGFVGDAKEIMISLLKRLKGAGVA